MASVEQLGNTQMIGWLRFPTFASAAAAAAWVSSQSVPDGVFCYRSDIKQLQLLVNGVFSALITEDALDAAPTITSITPAAGTPLGGDAVTIVGAGFFAGATPKIAGVACTSIVVVDENTITCVTPTGTTGARDVTVVTAAGTGTLAGGFTYAAAPTFTSITPNSGVAAGGTAVTIAGTGFVAGTTVTIGGVAVTSRVIVSSTSITCVTGAHSAGAVDVVITNINGAVTGAGAYTYT